MVSVHKLMVACLTIALGFWSVNAHAVWSESVQIVGETAVPDGASVTLILDSGDAIQGEVQEDDDGQFLVFILPGSAPQAGRIEISSSGTVRTYALSSRPAHVQLGLNLEGASTQPLDSFSTADSRPTADQFVRTGLRFTAGLSGGYWMSDFFSERIDRNTSELESILDNVFGGTNSSARGSADDSGAAYGANLGFEYDYANGTSMFVNFSYMAFDAADGRITGRTDVAGNDIVVNAAGESELDAYALTLGIRRPFWGDCNWRWYAAGGAMRLEMDDSSTTRTYVNGDEVDSFRSSSSDHDNAEFLEVGVSYELNRFSSRLPLTLEFGYRFTNETFNSENLSGALVGMSVAF